MKRTLALAVCLAALTPMQAFADSNASGGGVVNSESVFLDGPYSHGGDPGSADNSTTTATFTGGFNANQVRFSGTTTSIISTTWEDESDIEITSPGGGFGVPETFRWENGQTGQTYTSFDFDHAEQFGTAYGGAIDPAGTWSIEFIDTFDDGAGADSETTNLTMYFEETEELVDSNGSWDLGSISLGGSASSEGELALSGLFDLYTFSLTEAGYLSVFTEFQDVYTGASLDTEIAIFGSDGNLIAEDDDGGTGTYSGISSLALGAGDYTLAVAGWDTEFGDGVSVTAGDSTGDYGVSLSFSAVPEPTSAAILGLGALGLAFVRRRRA